MIHCNTEICNLKILLKIQDVKNILKIRYMIFDIFAFY